MPNKKKPAKPAKKTTPAKKTVSTKKPAVAKAVAAAKKASKVASAKKPVAKKSTSAKKTTPKKETKPVKAAPHKIGKTVTAKPASKAEVKKQATPIKVEHKTEQKNNAHKPEPKHTPPPVQKKPAEPAKPVKLVMPEIKTKTSRKYEPDFTKSVLDQPENIQTGPTMRYSDSDLEEFRELIQKKLDQAKKELTYLQGLITRKDEMGGDENENRYMTMEDGSMSMEREQLAQMASRQINYIDHLEKAMMRIENKTYGICRVTGKLIDKARLRAVPHATLSMEAKQTMNR